jgi:hypothetical protein
MADVCRAIAFTDGCSVVNISKNSAIEVGGLSDICKNANACAARNVTDLELWP